MAQIETLDRLKRRLTLSIDLSALESAYQKRLQTEAKRANIRGYRQGKVPAKVLERQSGKQIREQVLAGLVDEAFKSAVEELKLRVAGSVEVAEWPTALGVEGAVDVNVTLEVYPDIDLKDMKKEKIEDPECEITTLEIDEALDTLREQHQDWQVVERASQTGDRLTVDFEGTLADESSPMENGSAKDHVMILGKANMIDGFEQGLEGVSAGDEPVLSLTFPEDYHAKEIAGKAVTFKVIVHKVEEPILLSWEKLATQLNFEKGGVDAMREEVERNLTAQCEQARDSIQKENVLSVLRALNPIDIPAAVLDEEIHHMQQNMIQQWQQQSGQSVDMKEMSLPREPFVKQATIRVQNALLLQKVIEQNSIKPDPAQVDHYLEMITSRYESPEELRTQIRANPEQMAQITTAVLEKQAIVHIMQEASVTAKPYAYKDLLEAQRALQAEQSA